MMSENKRVLVHLSLIKGVGPAAIIILLKSLVARQVQGREYFDIHDVYEYYDKIALSCLYSFSIHDFKVLGISTRIAQLLVDGLANTKLYDEECARALRHSVHIITLCEDSYPESLRHIAQPPIVLYVRGGTLHGKRMLGIVGSRQATRYGEQFIKNAVPVLLSNGWTIVSGGALGIDTMAHKASLRHGRTVAVLGSGLLSFYPKENTQLFEQIIEQGGAIVSPFPLITSPDRWNFPARNRIIAGLSEGCLVVQAAEKSGALITADHALENGRTVFAVPGLVDDPLSRGCHALIKQGAVLVQTGQDVCDAFGQKESKCNEVGHKNAEEKKQELVFSDPLLSLMSGAVSIDELCERTGLDVAHLQNKLFELQLDGKVEQNFTGMWQRV